MSPSLDCLIIVRGHTSLKGSVEAVPASYSCCRYSPDDDTVQVDVLAVYFGDFDGVGAAG